MTEIDSSRPNRRGLATHDNPIAVELLPDFALGLATEYAKALRNPQLAPSLQTFLEQTSTISGVSAVVLGLEDVPTPYYLFTFVVSDLQGLTYDDLKSTRIRSVQETFRPLSRTFRETTDPPVRTGLTFINAKQREKDFSERIFRALTEGAAEFSGLRVEPPPLANVTVALVEDSFNAFW